MTSIILQFAEKKANFRTEKRMTEFYLLRSEKFSVFQWHFENILASIRMRKEKSQSEKRVRSVDARELIINIDIGYVCVCTRDYRWYNFEMVAVEKWKTIQERMHEWKLLFLSLTPFPSLIVEWVRFDFVEECGRIAARRILIQTREMQHMKTSSSVSGFGKSESINGSSNWNWRSDAETCSKWYV